MSLIGPRPERPAFCQEFEKRIHGWGYRTLVRPGLSGLAQVTGSYDLLPKEKVVLDLWGWLLRLLFLAVIFVAIAVVAAFATCRRSGSGVHATICNTDVEVKVGDLFSFDGIKVIPFDEYFDTEVDDKVISRNSLNGIFLERKVGHRDLILRTIAEPQQSILGGPEVARDGRLNRGRGMLAPRALRRRARIALTVTAVSLVGVGMIVLVAVRWMRHSTYIRA